MSRALLFYPLVLAAFPVVFLASQNAEKVTPAQVLPPLATVVAGTLLLILVLRMFVKDGPKVALFVTILLVIFFSYGRQELEGRESYQGISPGFQGKALSLR